MDKELLALGRDHLGNVLAFWNKDITGEEQDQAHQTLKKISS